MGAGHYWLTMKCKVKIKNSIVVLAGDDVREMIKRLDLSGKTPIDCMDLIRRIKYGYGKSAGL